MENIDRKERDITAEYVNLGTDTMESWTLLHTSPSIEKIQIKPLNTSINEETTESINRIENIPDTTECHENDANQENIENDNKSIINSNESSDTPKAECPAEVENKFQNNWKNQILFGIFNNIKRSSEIKESIKSGFFSQLFLLKKNFYIWILGLAVLICISKIFGLSNKIDILEKSNNLLHHEIIDVKKLTENLEIQFENLRIQLNKRKKSKNEIYVNNIKKEAKEYLNKNENLYEKSTKPKNREKKETKIFEKNEKQYDKKNITFNHYNDDNCVDIDKERKFCSNTGYEKQQKKNKLKQKKDKDYHKKVYESNDYISSKEKNSKENFKQSNNFETKEYKKSDINRNEFKSKEKYKTKDKNNPKDDREIKRIKNTIHDTEKVKKQEIIRNNINN